MPKRLIKFNIDFAKKDLSTKFEVKKLDDLNLEITMFENGVSTTYEGTPTLFVAIDKDVIKQETDIEINGNKILINLDRNILAKIGFYYGEFQIKDANGTVTSSDFIFSVKDKIGEGANIPGNIEGFVQQYQRLIKEFKEQVDNTVEDCSTRVDNKLIQLQKDYDTTKTTTIKSIEDKTDKNIEKVNKVLAAGTVDLETKKARIDMDGFEHIDLNARLESDLKKGKILEEVVEGPYVTIQDSVDGSITDIEVIGDTYQDPNDLSNIQSAGIVQEDGKVKMSILSCGKNLFEGYKDLSKWVDGTYLSYKLTLKPNTKYNFGGIVNKLTSNHCVLGVWDTPYSSSVSGKELANIFNVKSDGTNDIIGCVKSKLITTPADGVVYLRYYENGHRIVSNNIDMTQWITEIADVWIYESQEVVNTYEPYTESRCDITLPCQLESLESGRDRLYYDKDEKAWCVDKVTTRLFKNDIEILNEYASSTFNPRGFICVRTTPPFGTKGFSVSKTTNLCKGLKSKSLGDMRINTEKSFACYDDGNTDTKGIYICLTLEELGITKYDKDIITKYIRSSNFEFILAKEPQKIVLPLDIQVALDSFFGTTNAWVESGEVNGIIKGKVSKSIASSLQSAHDDIEKLDDRVKNIEGLQESQNFKYATSKGYEVCEQTKNGQIDKLKISGKTLVNRADIASNFNHLETTSWYRMGTLCETSKIKLDTIYTIVIEKEYLTNHNVAYNTLEFTLSNNIDGANDGPAIQVLSGNFTYNSSNHEIKVISVIFTDFKDYKYLTVRPCRRNTAPVSGEQANYKINFNILEGDHTQNPPNGYFEGLKSVGDGADKLEVLSRKEDGNLFDGSWIIGKTLDGTTGAEATQSNRNCTYFIRVKSGIKFKFEGADRKTFNCYDKNKSFLGNINSTYTTLPNTEYVRISIDNTIDFYKAILIEENYFKGYVPYKGNKKQILFKDTDDVWKKPILREWDTIEQHADGKWYYNVKDYEKVFTASVSENWIAYGVQTDKVYKIRISLDKSKPSGEVVCDKFNYIPNAGISANNTEFCTIDGNKDLIVSIDRTKLSTVDLNGAKLWLQANNVTVVYQLEQEEVYECTPLNLDSYANETMISFLGGPINTYMEFEITSHAGNMILGLRSRVNYLEDKLIEYTTTQNRLQLKSMYSADRVTFRVDTTVLSTTRSKQDIDYDVFNLLKDNIEIGIDNYNRLEVEEMMDFYVSIGKLDYNMWDELWIIMELQHNPPVQEEAPEIV